jgi:2-succinyl-6-hydroxy-2,4-cyclohexadiene-1-carboxylate synthase
MRVTTDDGVGLEVEVTGRGPALLLAHGFTGAKEDFGDHVDDLARHSTVVIFDHRGHGESDKPEREDAYSLGRLAADTLAIADALDFDRFRLLGHSMGGMVARRVVLGAPERVSALILMGTSPGRPTGVDPDLANVGVAVARTEGMVVLRELLDEMDPLGSEADRRVRRERPGYNEFMLEKFFAVPPEAYAALLLEIAHQPNQLNDLARVTCPTLIIIGEQDEAFLSDAHAMAGVVPDVELVVVPDAGHSPQFENPSAYLNAMERFLARVDAGARS